MAETEPSPLDALAEAVQNFVNAETEDASVVTGMVVVYEVVRFDEAGDELRSIGYTVPGGSASMSGSIGLLDAGLYMVRRDAIDDEAG
jgi:hypothetical protein